MATSSQPTVLHYVGYDDDRGGIVSVIRALATTDLFGCVLGINPGGVQRRGPALPELAFSKVDGEKIGIVNLWRTRAVAREVRAWLREDARRVFHGHSRAGLLVALWLDRMGERRVVASVHCYGRQRWFYRSSGRRLGERLFWLSPAMKRYYGGESAGAAWVQCIPGCVTMQPRGDTARARDAARTALRLGGVGALVSWKRWELVLNALAKLPRAARERVTFRHIGTTDGSGASLKYQKKLETLTPLLGLQAQVQWLGHQASSAALLAESDCLVIASHNEPFSVAALEALHAGVPVLAADSGGALDLITPGQEGWFFHSGNPRNLSEKILMLLESDALDRARVDPDRLARFSATRVAEQWLAVYQKLLTPDAPNAGQRPERRDAGLG